MPTKAVNTFLSGLNLSVDSINQPKDTYSYALNAIKEDSVNNPEVLSNEKGFTTEISLGYSYILLGTIYLGKKDYIYFIKNIEGSSAFNRILLVHDGVATTKLDNINLNFKETNIIKGTYRINFKNERIIYWVDGYNKDRVFNIDNGIAITDVAQLSLDISYVPGVLTSKTVNDNNGTLKTGAYEFYASYKSKDNAVTPWFILNAKPVYIMQANINNIPASGYINIDGSDSGLPTTKSIKLEIANLDISFDTLRIGVLKTVNGNTTAYFIDNITYDTSTKEYTYTGFDDETLVSNLADFTTDIVRYYGSNTIIQSNSRLVRANTKAVKINIDYQSYANNIDVDYYVSEDMVLSMPDSTDYETRSNWWKNAATKYTDDQTLMRDEVVSVGIAFGLIREGIETEVYHIPGRKLNDIPVSVYQSEFKNVSSVAYNSTWDSATVTDNGDTVPRWKVQNTAARSTNDQIHKLGYWESNNKYPSGFNFPTTGSSSNGTNNTNIRHHKIPSSNIEPIYRTELASGNYNVFKRNIGLTFNNIVIPDELKGNVAYIRIYITPRDSEQNKSVIAKGIFINCALTRIFSYGDATHTPTTNLWVAPVAPYNDQDDYLNDLTFQKYNIPANTTNNHYHSFYSPDTLLKNPLINVDRVYIENELTGIAHYYNTRSPQINIDPARGSNSQVRRSNADNGGYKRDLFYSTGGALIPTRSSTSASGDQYNVSNIFKSTYKSIAILNKINKIPSGKVSRKIKKAVYVPFNAQLSTDQLGGMDNPYYSPYGAANILIELDPAYSVLGATDTPDTSVDFTDNNSAYNNLERTADYGLNTNGTFHFHTITNPQVVYRYGSIKRSNPIQYGEISGLNYTPTDLVIANPQFDINNTLTTSLSGLIGDSYIDLFSIKRVRYAAKEGYTFGNLPEISVGISSFLTESQTNLRLRYAEGTPINKTYYPKILLTTPPQEYFDWGNNPSIVTSDSYFKSNADFDKISSKQNYGPNEIDLQTSGLIGYPTRLVYSEKLLNETISDSYRVFLANNYLDLSKNTGFITHLFNKQQELYAVTRDSLWRLFASNQTIKSNSEENITVGTGEFLANEPVEMLSIEGGYAGSSSKASLVETPYGYFYCDRYKGRFILFDGQQKDISIKGVNNFTKDNFALEIVSQLKELDTDFDSPLTNFGYLAGYEPENNRLLITKLDYKFTPSTFEKYKGIYNPATTYTDGDIYLKDGILYTFNSSTTAYTTISENTNLSDFVTSTVEPITFTVTSGASHGTAIVSPLDTTKVQYTPTTSYVGADAFNIGVGCSITTVNVTVEDAPTVSNYTVSLAETSTNGTNVQDVDGTYSGHTLTYSIVSGNTFDIFSINSSTGQITVNNDTYLDYDLVQQVVLNIRTIADNSKTVDSTVTINVTRLVENPTHPNATIDISPSSTGGTLVYTIPQASYPHPVSPYSQLIYSVVSQSTPGIFVSDLDDPTDMTVTLVNDLVTPPYNYTITYRASDNLDSTRFVDFTLTINVVVYYNTQQNQVFTKNNCTGQYHGSNVNYVVPAGTYVSEISIADANNMALADIAANGQNYANTNGICIENDHWFNVQKSGTATKQGCPTHYHGSLETYIVAAGTFKSYVSQLDADNQAQAAVDAGKQAYANSVGTCIEDDNWFNQERSAYATKNDCTGETDGTVVTYTVAAGVYKSYISQADANAMAQSDVDSNKQAYANANGTCIARALINYSVSQYEAPYIDNNLQFKDNGVEIFTVNGNAVGSFYLPAGHIFQTESFIDDPETGGVNPEMQLKWVKNGVTVYDNTVSAVLGTSIVHSETLEAGKTYDITSRTYEAAGGTVPTCPDRVLVFQICNSNASRDDNFDIYLNDTYIGAVNLNDDAQIGSTFIASLSSPDIVSADFTCPLESMVNYYFNPALLQASNTIHMVNTQNNDNGNFGTVGIRNYEIASNQLSNPCVVADLQYSGGSGDSFVLSFGYTACCPGDV